MAHDAFGDVAALHAIFHPKTVAVMGPTAEPDTLGHKTLAALTSGGAFPTPASVGYELEMGSRADPEFGPVLWVGAGGRLADLSSDRVVGLPPLDATLARRMLERSAIFDGRRRLSSRGAVNLGAIEASLAAVGLFRQS